LTFVFQIPSERPKKAIRNIKKGHKKFLADEKCFQKREVRNFFALSAVA